MREYKVSYPHPDRATVKLLKTTAKEYKNKVDCVKDVIKSGDISVVNFISSRSDSKSKFTRLDGPGYLELWKEYARQKKLG